MIASRASHISPFMAMDIMEKAQTLERQGRPVIHLELGEPDFDTPECVKEACIRAIRDGYTHYTHSLGLIELREAICGHYLKKYGVSVSPDQILVTSGTSPALLILLATLLDKGDEVIIADPHYSCYPNFIRFFEGNPVTSPMHEEEGFALNVLNVSEKITGRTKAILINSPSNPTGNLLSADQLKQMAALGVPVIADDIYHGLVYEGEEHCILEYTDRAFVINGFSKAYAMTGWRLGYLIAPRDFMRPMQNIQQNLFISANSVAQWGGVAALREGTGDVLRMKNIFNERRICLLRRLREIGLGIAVEPTGAFYAMANIKKYNVTSYELAIDILEKAGVGVTPGSDFGRNGEGYLRFSYANSVENISKALAQIERYLGTLERQ